MYTEVNKVGLDFETYCDLNIKDVGVARYVEHESFTPLIAAIATDFGIEVFTFLDDSETERFLTRLKELGDVIYAHNAAFERKVLGKMFPEEEFSFVDTAVIGRALGAVSSLANAGPQLLGMEKLADGQRLIKKFCTEKLPDISEFTEEDHADWRLFKFYCAEDARLSLSISQLVWDENENNYWRITDRMNQLGWFVDRDSAIKMKELAEKNKEQVLEDFRSRLDPDHELNFNSPKQLQEWCKERGVLSKSFDEQNVEKLIMLTEKRKAAGRATEGQLEVLEMLYTKREMGGSSLSKLDTILSRVSDDGRLRDQYLHVGAGQTYRTSGVGVQMQNLKRLPVDLQPLEEVLESDPTNDQLAENIRQLFMAEHPEGELIVGDFSSVESRGLAWLAGQDDKLDAYRQGQDIYKVNAAKHYGIDYDEVDKPQRTFGKVGELSCGYQAGPGAVKDFAEKMGVHLTEEQALEIVRGWRSSNDKIVKLWADLDTLLIGAFRSALSGSSLVLPKGLILTMTPLPSIVGDIHPGAKDLFLKVRWAGSVWFSRVFRGVYMESGKLFYHKASNNKTGPLWVKGYMHEKKFRKYSIYGGKLSGILTQSLCREIFMMSLASLHRMIEGYDNVKIVGQFHDEIVVEWSPGKISRTSAIMLLDHAMSNTLLKSFPLACEIGHSRRYIK